MKTYSHLTTLLLIVTLFANLSPSVSLPGTFERPVEGNANVLKCLLVPSEKNCL